MHAPQDTPYSAATSDKARAERDAACSSRVRSRAVENSGAAILLIVGGDDRGYGPAYHEVTARRLAAIGYRQPWKHIVYDGASHMIISPTARRTAAETEPGPGGVKFLQGGTVEIDIAAQAETWRETVAFLGEHLGRPDS